MAVSHYFNNYAGNRTSEQGLMEDVIVESIQIMGHNVQYLPRESWDGDDQIFGEKRNSKFNRAYTMEAYIANVEGYEGDGDFFSKFGLEIRDTSNFVISRRAFERYVPSTVATRPREGDLIYIPVMRKIFEIKFIEEELMFFSLGNREPYIYELRCEMFRYNDEDIDTGVADVDIIEELSAYSIELNLNNGSGSYRKGEIVYQGANAEYAIATAEVKNWNSSEGKIQLLQIKGEFAGGSNLIGVTSNAIYNIVSTDTLGDFNEYDLFDNKDLQTEADDFIDFTETNPFGTP
jgi:hypothetical protein